MVVYESFGIMNLDLRIFYIYVLSFFNVLNVLNVICR